LNIDSLNEYYKIVVPGTQPGLLKKISGIEIVVETVCDQQQIIHHIADRMA
jgi:hypothetical protein